MCLFDFMGDKEGLYNSYLCLVAICIMYLFGQMLECLIDCLLWFYFIPNWEDKWANLNFYVKSNATIYKRELVWILDREMLVTGVWIFEIWEILIQKKSSNP